LKEPEVVTTEIQDRSPNKAGDEKFNTFIGPPKNAIRDETIMSSGDGDISNADVTQTFKVPNIVNKEGANIQVEQTEPKPEAAGALVVTKQADSGDKGNSFTFGKKGEQEQQDPMKQTEESIGRAVAVNAKKRNSLKSASSIDTNELTDMDRKEAVGDTNTFSS